MYGISVGAIGTMVKNNIVLETGDYPLDALSGTLVAHSNNLFYKTGVGAIVARYGGSYYTAETITSFDPTSLSVDPQFASQLSP